MQRSQEVSIAQDLQLNEIQAVIKALMLKMCSEIIVLFYSRKMYHISWIKQDSCLASKGENQISLHVTRAAQPKRSRVQLNANIQVWNRTLTSRDCFSSELSLTCTLQSGKRQPAPGAAGPTRRRRRQRESRPTRAHGAGTGGKTGGAPAVSARQRLRAHCPRRGGPEAPREQRRSRPSASHPRPRRGAPGTPGGRSALPCPGLSSPDRRRPGSAAPPPAPAAPRAHLGGSARPRTSPHSAPRLPRPRPGPSARPGPPRPAPGSRGAAPRARSAPGPPSSRCVRHGAPVAAPQKNTDRRCRDACR